MPPQRIVGLEAPLFDVPWPAVFAGGCLLLLARPFVSAALLPLPYLLLGATALLVSMQPRSAGGLHPAIVLVAGCIALLAARAVAGIGIPARGGASAVALNTLAAVSEEAFFRRFLYGALARRGVALAVGGSALAFALLHVPAYGTQALPVDLGAGLLLSWQRWASGRWEIPAATHAAANILVMIR